MLGLALGLGYSGDRTARTKEHSSHNLLIEGPARKREGKEKMQPSKNNCVFRKEKIHVNGQSLLFKSTFIPKYK